MIRLKFLSYLILIPFFGFSQNIIETRVIDDRTYVSLEYNTKDETYVKILGQNQNLIDSIYIGAINENEYVQIGSASVDSSAYEFVIITKEQLDLKNDAIPENSIKIYSSWLYEPVLQNTRELDPNSLIRYNEGYYFK